MLQIIAYKLFTLPMTISALSVDVHIQPQITNSLHFITYEWSENTTQTVAKTK